MNTPLGDGFGGFETINGSSKWRTHFALRATFVSPADGGFRDQIQMALSHVEQSRIACIAKAWEQLSALFGYRLRSDPSIGVLR
jgi:hypothetical protein